MDFWGTEHLHQQIKVSTKCCNYVLTFELKQRHQQVPVLTYLILRDKDTE